MTQVWLHESPRGRTKPSQRTAGKGDEMQTRAAGATRDEQHSLAPIQLEGTGLERDLASIKRGQGKRLVFALLGSLLATLGLLQWMKSSDGHSAYASAARRLDARSEERRVGKGWRAW